MRISDWSSDVCSSDLRTLGCDGRNFFLAILVGILRRSSLGCDKTTCDGVVFRLLHGQRMQFARLCAANECGFDQVMICDAPPWPFEMEAALCGNAARPQIGRAHV